MHLRTFLPIGKKDQRIVWLCLYAVAAALFNVGVGFIVMTCRAKRAESLPTLNCCAGTEARSADELGCCATLLSAGCCASRWGGGWCSGQCGGGSLLSCGDCCASTADRCGGGVAECCAAVSYSAYSSCCGVAAGCAVCCCAPCIWCCHREPYTRTAEHRMMRSRGATVHDAHDREHATDVDTRHSHALYPKAPPPPGTTRWLFSTRCAALPLQDDADDSFYEADRYWSRRLPARDRDAALRLSREEPPRRSYDHDLDFVVDHSAINRAQLQGEPIYAQPARYDDGDDDAYTPHHHRHHHHRRNHPPPSSHHHHRQPPRDDDFQYFDYPPRRDRSSPRRPRSDHRSPAYDQYYDDAPPPQPPRAYARRPDPPHTPAAHRPADNHSRYSRAATTPTTTAHPPLAPPYSRY